MILQGEKMKNQSTIKNNLNTQGGKTALYTRLSRDDDEMQGESNSIKNQKELLTQYAKSKGYTDIEIYVDDGYSGTNFNRPNFKRMIERIETGDIKRVIVKDMSRFGRNYLEVGYYTEILFPEYEIQFIAVNDNVDSESQADNDFTPFRNIMNEWYAKDISKKMKSAIRAKGNTGKHTSPLPPYGYMKDPNDKHKWIVDEQASEVVKKIFKLCMQGYGPTQIANILTDNNIDPPTVHAKKMGRKVSMRDNEICEEWVSQTVSLILGYREYLGWTVNFKTKKKSFKSKKIILTPQSEWQVHKGTQEPIIDEETFWTVQKIRDTRRHLDRLGEPSIFSNMLYCGDCGNKLYLRRQRNPKQKDYFVCATYRKKRKCNCSAHFIRLEDIERVVLNDIQQITLFATDHESEFLDLIKSKTKSETEKLRAEKKSMLDKATHRNTEIDEIIQKLYEDNLIGKITDERFIKLSTQYEAEQKELRQTIENLKTELITLTAEIDNTTKFLSIVRTNSCPTTLTAELVRTFIDKIIVYESTLQHSQNTDLPQDNPTKTQPLQIIYNCIGTIPQPPTQILSHKQKLITTI